MLLCFFVTYAKSQDVVIKLENRIDTLYFEKTTANEIKAKYGNVKGYEVKGKFKKGHWSRVKIGSFFIEYENLDVTFGFYCLKKEGSKKCEYLLEQIILKSKSKACIGDSVCVGMNEKEIIKKIGDAPKNEIGENMASYYHSMGMLVFYDKLNMIVNQIQINYNSNLSK